MSLPKLEIFCHVDETGLDLSDLRQKLESALPECMAQLGTEDPVLSGLARVEFSIVSDETIARVHGDFMDDPTPTDVITFHHGDVLVSLDTAERESGEHGHSADRELLLYMIHGLLHLNGHTDLVEPARTEMHKQQERILQSVYPR